EDAIRAAVARVARRPRRQEKEAESDLVIRIIAYVEEGAIAAQLGADGGVDLAFQEAVREGGAAREALALAVRLGAYAEEQVGVGRGEVIEVPRLEVGAEGDGHARRGEDGGPGEAPLHRAAPILPIVGPATRVLDGDVPIEAPVRQVERAERGRGVEE